MGGRRVEAPARLKGGSWGAFGSRGRQNTLTNFWQCFTRGGCVIPSYWLRTLAQSRPRVIEAITRDRNGDKWPAGIGGDRSGDRGVLRARVVVLREIFGMIRPEPARPAPLPPATAL